jgi:hypothetical protein
MEALVFRRSSTCVYIILFDLWKIMSVSNCPFPILTVVFAEITGVPVASYAHGTRVCRFWARLHGCKKRRVRLLAPTVVSSRLSVRKGQNDSNEQTFVKFRTWDFYLMFGHIPILVKIWQKLSDTSREDTYIYKVCLYVVFMIETGCIPSAVQPQARINSGISNIIDCWSVARIRISCCVKARTVKRWTPSRKHKKHKLRIVVISSKHRSGVLGGKVSS